MDRCLGAGLAVAAAFGSTSISTAQENPLDRAPPVEWLRNNAPFGMDITLDGEVWINLHEIGRKSDFAMHANDLYRATGRHRRAWIRGYHLRNRDVSYRETRSLIFVDCTSQTLGQVKSVAYDSEMKVVEELGFEDPEPVVPGTYSATYLRKLCGA